MSTLEDKNYLFQSPDQDKFLRDWFGDDQVNKLNLRKMKTGFRFFPVEESDVNAVGIDAGGIANFEIQDYTDKNPLGTLAYVIRDRDLTYKNIPSVDLSGTYSSDVLSGKGIDVTVHLYDFDVIGFKYLEIAPGRNPENVAATLNILKEYYEQGHLLPMTETPSDVVTAKMKPSGPDMV